MATESLSAVVIEVLENNLRAGKSFIEAYRVGGVRLAHAIGARWERGQKVAEMWGTRIAQVSTGADKVLEKVYGGATSAIETVSERVGTVDNPYAVRYFDYVGKAALPGMKLVRTLSNRMADGVETVYDRLAPPKSKVVRKPAVKAAGRGGRKSKGRRAA
jgi:hypothetical protein